MAFVPFVESDQPTMAAFNEKFQQNYEAAVAAGVKVESGSYVGNGASGSGNPKSLTFGFQPKIVVVSGEASTNSRNAGFCVFLWGNPTPGEHDLSSAGILVATYSGNTISWYATASIGSNGTSGAADANQQLNVTNRTYRYIAIG